jgi:hypothetical protein
VILRQHFEKLLLVLVMMGLAGAVYYLSLASQEEKQKVREYFEKTKVATNLKGFEPVDLTTFESNKTSLENPTPLNFSTPHNLMNPVKWQQRPDQKYIKVQSPKDIGPYALTVAAIRPLHLSIAFERSAGSGYWLLTTNEASVSRTEVSGFRQYATVGSDSTKVFKLKEARPPEDPTEWDVELLDGGEVVTLTKEQPYRRVVGYEADLRYDVEGRTFKDQREGRSIRLSGESYNIVAIRPDEVVLSADSNDRRYAITLDGAP